MNNVLLISPDYVRQFTFISSTVSDNLITNSIRKAQELYIQGVLGKPLYDKILKDVYDAGSITGITGDYLYLFENFIEPALLEWSLYESTMPLFIQANNKGLSQRNDNYSQGADIEMVKYLRGELRNNAENYQERLIKYMCLNNQKFPEYTQNDPDIGQYPDGKTGSYNGGVYFPNRRRVNRNNPFSYNDED